MQKRITKTSINKLKENTEQVKLAESFLYNIKKYNSKPNKNRRKILFEKYKLEAPKYQEVLQLSNTNTKTESIDIKRKDRFKKIIKAIYGELSEDELKKHRAKIQEVHNIGKGLFLDSVETNTRKLKKLIDYFQTELKDKDKAQDISEILMESGVTGLYYPAVLYSFVLVRALGYLKFNEEKVEYYTTKAKNKLLLTMTNKENKDEKRFKYNRQELELLKEFITTFNNENPLDDLTQQFKYILGMLVRIDDGDESVRLNQKREFEKLSKSLSDYIKNNEENLKSKDIGEINHLIKSTEILINRFQT